LDAFGYYSYTLSSNPGTIRLGKQVLSWGESTFIQNGINASNPIDAASFRRPGSEIKEALIPVEMLNIAQSITPDLSTEIFYQFKWRETVVDNCGTFFAGDIVAKGCDNNMVVLGTENTLKNQGITTAKLKELGVNWGNPDEGVIVKRNKNQNPKDDGQWGVNVRYMSNQLDTEFGLFFMNYHSKMPFFSAQALSAQDVVKWWNDPLIKTLPPQVAGQIMPIYLAGKSAYFMEYPQNIRLYGASFSTSLPSGTAVQGEISYRPNLPIQINSTDILYSLVPGASRITSNPGDLITGYKRKEVTQIQTTFTHIFDNTFIAGTVFVIGEIGYVHVGNLAKDNLRYGRDPDFGPGALPNGMCETLNVSALGDNKTNINRYCNNQGFTTRDSYGYRVATELHYDNVFNLISLKPKFSFSHDVKGYSPEPAASFIEGRKAFDLGLTAEYRRQNNTYNASINYTNFFGGTYNTLIDRDFASLSFGVHF